MMLEHTILVTPGCYSMPPREQIILKRWVDEDGSTHTIFAWKDTLDAPNFNNTGKTFRQLLEADTDNNLGWKQHKAELKKKGIKYPSQWDTD